MGDRNWRRVAAFAMAGAAATALSGCFLMPGSFDSTLNLRADGRFNYTYVGEVHFLGMGEMAEMAEMAEGESGATEPCYSEETGEERPCTDDEIAEQQAEAQMGAEAMQAMMGGLNPDDPEAAEEFASALERQAGWNEVTYAGDGMFEVDFEISSTLTHDFSFPTIEQMPMPSTFVSATLRDDGRVRIDAPGFSPGGSGNPFAAMMGGMAGMFEEGGTGESAAEESAQMPDIPEIEGTFRIVTDGRILANNTDDGPRETAEGEMLEWDISPRTGAVPTALIELNR